MFSKSSSDPKSTWGFLYDMPEDEQSSMNQPDCKCSWKDVFFAALTGWVYLLGERNAKIHLFATIGVIISGFVFAISATEWTIILIVTAGVWTAEAFNSAIEELTDEAFHEIHPRAKKIKDLSAGAVLFQAIGSIVIGLIIFVPKILAWMRT